MFVPKCCWKIALCCSSCASFHIPPLPGTRPMTMRERERERERKVGWSEKLNHGKDMCCSLILLKTGEKNLWERKESSFHWKSFFAFRDPVLTVSALFSFLCARARREKQEKKSDQFKLFSSTLSWILHNYGASLLSLPGMVAAGIRFPLLGNWSPNPFYTSRETRGSS